MKMTGYLYAIGASILWGLVYAINQKILTKASPLAFLFVGSVVCLAIILPLIFFDPQSIKAVLQSGKTNLWLILLTSLFGTLATFFIFSAVKILGASNASVFEIAYPFFVILFSWIFFRTSLNWYFLGGAILIFAGSYVIIRFG